MLAAVRPQHDLGKRAKTTLLAAFVSAVSLLAGCGGGIGGYCEAAAECERGNDADIQACELRFDETQQVADLKNCSAEFDDYINCIEESARCNNDEYKVTDGQCGDENDRLEKCIK
jgi:hypothetical protein